MRLEAVQHNVQELNGQKIMEFQQSQTLEEQNQILVEQLAGNQSELKSCRHQL